MSAAAGAILRPMADADFAWAAALMERRRERAAAFSPVFWRPARGVTEGHGRFLAATAAHEGAVALRTDHGFVVSAPHDGRWVVDDFAVDDDARWPTDGRDLLRAVVGTVDTGARPPVVRAVTARRDEPKRRMLRDAGLAAVARWWVKELTPVGGTATWGPVTLAGVAAVLAPAPPVYDPGGPVCLLGDIEAVRAIEAASAAAAAGAVLAIVRRDRSPAEVPEEEPELEVAGFHNASEFYEGVPAPRP